MEGIKKVLKTIVLDFREGGPKTRVSYLILGFGQLCRGQIVKGIAFLLSEVAFIAYLIGFGARYFSKLSTLGTTLTKKTGRTTVYGDNSFLILLFGILTVFIIVFFLVIWYLNIQDNHEAERLLKAGKKLPGNKEVLGSLLDKHFDKTLLALPVTGIFLFTVLPIAFMICVAFTNYDYNHQAPTNLFTWVGFENFR
ncbi:MAG: sugar ABC transporter permease, partial [Lachnospiraceae bacterium]|nr:sugar ABC transporter permease [Lachnospiraceae bacterium]